MLSLDNILNTKVAYQQNAWSSIDRELAIKTVLDQIKSGEYKSKIEVLRKSLEEGNMEYYDSYKKHLPAVTFSATFIKNRKKEDINQYNKIIVIDIDNLESSKLKVTFENLLSDEHVISFWRSPSNSGYKGLVSIDYKFSYEEQDLDLLHKSAFRKLSLYFLEKYDIKLDKSGSDITRLCFLSYDANLTQKTNFKKFELAKENKDITVKPEFTKNKQVNFISSRDALLNPLNRNNHNHRETMTSIIRYLNNKQKSITYAYEDWYKVAMAIANTFTYEIGLKYFLKLSLMDAEKYNKEVCTNFLINCYENRKGSVTFASIIYLANQNGYKTKAQKNGIPKVGG